MSEYSVPTTTSPNLFPVDGVVHRNIGSDFLVHLFVSLLVKKKSFKTMSESDDQSATHVGLLHSQDTEDGNLSEVWREKDH